MNQELCAYLIRNGGRAWELPTDELLGALDQLRQASTLQGQSKSSGSATAHEFLQTVRRIMRTSRSMEDGQTSGSVLQRNS